ncbi:hypothetical protein [Granulicoccus phenolivorans]|uniref:hypothetical protein n=1 Tax=Granulicoccus phenolivorans TaxID=266854 RepID=UPI00042A7412|nr:hypothetical protein [Granulicoccus phenolivorans]
MRLPRIASAAFLALALTACSGISLPDSATDSRLQQGLAHVQAVPNADRFSVTFYDVRTIRDTIGSDGTEDYAGTRGSDLSPTQRWDLAATSAPFSHLDFDPSRAPRTIPTPHTLGWTLYFIAFNPSATRVTVAGGAEDHHAYARTELAAAGWTENGDDWTNPQAQQVPARKTNYRLADGNIYAEQPGTRGTSGPSAADPVLRDERLKPVLKCLDNPVAAHIVVSAQGTYALGAAVDAAGNGQVWSCIHAPGDPQALADSLRPQYDWVEIVSSKVDGEVVRTELRVAERDPRTPGAIQLIQRAPESVKPQLF